MDLNIIEDILTILNRLKQSFFEFLPNLAAAVLIFLFGLLLAHLTRMVVVRFISKLHHIIPNQAIRNRLKNFIEKKPLTRIISGILFWTLIFFFLTLATETLGLPVMTTWLGGIAGYLPKILFSCLIGIAGVIGGSILRDLIITASASAGIMYGNVLGKMAQVVIILVTVLIGMDQVGIDVTLLTSLFIIAVSALLLGAALAFGFGAKTSVGNILASYYLQKIFKVGDNVRIGDKEGTIVEITPHVVILLSPEGRTCVPAQLFNQGSSVLLSKENP